MARVPLVIVLPVERPLANRPLAGLTRVLRMLGVDASATE
jgi:hypothetical protein